MITLQMQGLTELLQRVRTLDDKIQKKVIRRSVYAGAKIMKQSVVDHAPVAGASHYRGGRLVPPGTLKRAPLHKWARELSDLRSQAYVVTLRRGKEWRSVGKRGVDKDAYYWPWVEYGHKVVARQGKAGKSTLRARRTTALGRVPERPFFRPAYQAAEGPARDAIKARMEGLLTEVLNER